VCSTTVCPVHNFPPPSELLVCYQPHRQGVMPGQKSIYETFLVRTPPSPFPYYFKGWLIGMNSEPFPPFFPNYVLYPQLQSGFSPNSMGVAHSLHSALYLPFSGTILSLFLSPTPTPFYTVKKKIKFSSYIKKFRRDSFLIYDFATHPYSIYVENSVSFFINVL
jgi:hypothetical protein